VVLLAGANLPGAVKSKSSSNPVGGSARVTKTLMKPSFNNWSSAFSSVGTGRSAFCASSSTLDLPSMNLSTFMRSRERDAVFWLIWVTPLAVLVSIVFRSISVLRLAQRMVP
jgi:hypothetical protein